MLPFMMGITSLMVILPQLVSVLTTIPIDTFTYTKICIIFTVSNLCFFLGFLHGKLLNNKNHLYLLDFKSLSLKKLIVLMTIIGGYFSYKNLGYMNIGQAENRSAFLINNLLSIYLTFASLLSIIILIRTRKFKTYITIPIILYFICQLSIIIVGARRSNVLSVTFLLSFLLYYLYPNLQKKIRTTLFVIFLFGGVISASISSVRKALESKSTIENIDYWNLFLSSFSTKVNEDTGMDVFNCIKGINYVSNTSSYSYGADFWNGFVNVYVPRFIIGEKAKENLKIKTGYDKYIPLWTHEITTMTGYFDGYASFSYFGAFLFYLLGFIGGKLYLYSKKSSFYCLLYLMLLIKIHSLFSHGIQYYITILETFIIFFIPLVIFQLKNKRFTIHNIRIKPSFISNSNNKK